MIKKVDFTFRFFDENGKQIGSDYGGGAAYDLIGLEGTLKFINDRLREDIKGFE